MSESPSNLLALDVPCNRHAPAIVRCALAEIDQAGLPLGDGVLVASELVTNAVLRSRREPEHVLEVRAGIHRGRLVISVHDRAAGSATAYRARDARLNFWGARIIERVALRWGCERPDGYRVWAELAVRP